MRRLEFAGRWLLQVCAVFGWLMGLAYWPKSSLPPNAGAFVATVWMLLGGPLLGWLWVCMQVQRLRDARAPLPWLVVGFAPAVGFIVYAHAVSDALVASLQATSAGASGLGGIGRQLEPAMNVLLTSLALGFAYSLVLMIVPGRYRPAAGTARPRGRNEAGPSASVTAVQPSGVPSAWATLAESWKRLNEPGEFSSPGATERVEVETVQPSQPEPTMSPEPLPDDPMLSRWKPLILLGSLFLGAYIGMMAARDADRGSAPVGAILGALLGVAAAWGSFEFVKRDKQRRPPPS